MIKCCFVYIGPTSSVIGVFSDLSLAFKDHFDVIAAVTYTIVVVSTGPFVNWSG